MAIEFTCPACGGALRVRDAAVGRVVRCGGCMTLLRVPDAPPTPDPESTAFPGGEPEPARPAPPPAPESLFPDLGEPPPRPVRDTRFWLTVTAATLLLGAFGCCGLAAFILPDPEWREHESRPGGFRVELPGEPRRDMERRFREQGLRLQRMKAVEGTHLWARAENYAVAYRDLPDAPRGAPRWVVPQWDVQTNDEILDAQVRELLGDLRQVGRAEQIDAGGFPGREFEYQARSGAVYTGRVVLAGARVYVLLAGGRFTEPGDGNVRRFLESFEITDPKLAAEGKRHTRERLRELGEVAAATALEAALKVAGGQ
jgi:hypothetical protein